MNAAWPETLRAEARTAAPGSAVPGLGLLWATVRGVDLTSDPDPWSDLQRALMAVYDVLDAEPPAPGAVGVPAAGSVEDTAELREAAAELLHATRAALARQAGAGAGTAEALRTAGVVVTLERLEGPWAIRTG